MKPKLVRSKGHPPGLKLVFQRDHHNQHRLLREDEEDEGFGENDTVPCSAAAAVSNSWGTRPLIAVPFKWEAEPGVPKKQNPKDPMEARPQAAAPATDDAERDPQQKANNKSAGVVAQSLAPPPRLMIPSNSTTSGSGSGRDQHHQHKSLDRHRPAAPPPKSPMALNSPRSPRSISLSKKMKSLLQGKLKRSPSSSSSSSSFPSSPAAGFSPKVYDSSASSPRSPFWVADFDKRAAVKGADREREEQEEHDVESCTSVSRCSSSDIVFDFSSFPIALKPPHHRGPRIQQQQQCQQQFQQQSSGICPFKNMSSMLLELWYGGERGSNPALADSGFSIISPSSTASSSSSSDLESPGSSTDNSMGSFSSDSESSNPVPRRDHQIKTSFDNDEQCGRHFVGLAAEKSEPETSKGDAAAPRENLHEKFDQAAPRKKLHEQHQHDQDRESCKQDEFDGESIADEDFSLDFDDDDNSSVDLLAERFCFKSDRFRVESSESAALVSSSKQIEMRDGDSSLHQQHQPEPAQKKLLPSALKKKDSFKSNVNASLKKVRFAVVEDVHKFEQDDQDDEEEPEKEIQAITSQVAPDSPNSAALVLSRYSSRSASRFDGEEDEFTPSPRVKRDISQVLLHIVRTDAELNRKQKGTLKFKISRW